MHSIAQVDPVLRAQRPCVANTTKALTYGCCAYEDLLLPLFDAVADPSVSVRVFGVNVPKVRVCARARLPAGLHRVVSRVFLFFAGSSQPPHAPHLSPVHIRVREERAWEHRIDCSARGRSTATRVVTHRFRDSIEP